MYNVKDKLFVIFKSLMKRAEAENISIQGSKCTIHKSVKQTAVFINGTINIGENTQLEKCKLLGKITLDKNIKTSNSVISGNITIGSYSKIIDGVELYGNIEIGKHTTINGPNTDFRSVINSIIIGNFCSIARNVTFQEYNHDFSKMTSYFIKCNMQGKSMQEDVVSKGAIILGHDVWIGTQCVVLSGAKIGTGAVIAANSVVTGEIPPYAIAAGSPAKVIKYRFDEKKIEELLESEWWNKSNEEVIELYNRFVESK